MKKKKFLYGIMAAAISLESSVMPVSAGEVDAVEPTGYFYTIPGEWNYSKELKHHTYNGRIAYCIEPRAIVMDGDVYAEEAIEAWTGASAYSRETILLASAFGEGYSDRNGYLWYAAAQDVIWNETGVAMDWGANNNAVHNAAAQIRSSINAYRAAPDFHFTDTVENREVGSSGNHASLKDGVIGRMYKITDQTGVVGTMHTGKASGLHVFNENQQEIQASEISTGSFYVRNDVPFQEGSITFTGIAGGTRFNSIPIILYGNANAPAAQKHIVTGNVAPRSYDLKITVTDTPYNPRKTDENGNGMKGAALSVEKDGQSVDAWTSDGKAHQIRLRMGESYQLKESDAPDGYYCKDFSFTVPKANQTDVISDYVNDDKIRYEVLKTDENDHPVKGAKLALYDVTDGSAKLVKMDDKKGNPWISDDKPRDISAYLHVNHTYSIVEQDVSTKYFLAEDTTFTVSKYAPEGNPMITENITDNHILYRFAKVDENGKPVEDAELKIYDLDDHNREVYHFTTGAVPTVVGLMERGHHYRLVETKTPDGKYTMVEKDFTVPVNHSADPITITGIDFTIFYYADKLDENDQPVAGASMEVHDVTNGADLLIQTFVSSDQPQLLEGMIAGHQYILRETAAPDGHYLAEDTPFTVPVHGTSEPVHVKVLDHTIKLPIRKTDTDGHPLADITLEVIDQETGTSIGSWKTKPDTDIEIGSLVHVGKEYILRETESINGYYYHKDVTFRIPEHYTEGMDISVTMQDAPIRIQVIKEDETGKPLDGAHITLCEKGSEEIVHEWDTVLEPQDISAYIYPEKTYVLRETEIVGGHYQAIEQEFTVSRYPEENNPMITMTMIDETINYEIAKVDEKGSPVKGVHLKVTDMETNEVIDEWDTDENMHDLSGILNAGHTYLLEETEWINGVVKAQDMQFTVPMQGTSASVRIKMLDETLDMSFLKTDENGKPLRDAELAILDEEGNEICSFYSTDDPHGVSSLADGTPISSLLKGGNTYRLHEKKAPFGYDASADVEFTASGTLARPQVISMTDRASDIYIHLIKADASNPDQKLADAHLTVYRKSDHHVAVDREGKKAVLITDENGDAWIKLAYDPDGYYVKETEAPKGYQLTSEIHVVKVTDEKGFTKENPIVVHILNDQEVDTGASADWRMPATLISFSLIVLFAAIRYRKHV